MMRRRGFLGGLLALAAPAVIRTPGLLMPIRPLLPPEGILRIRELLWPGVEQWWGSYAEIGQQWTEAQDRARGRVEMVRTVDEEGIVSQVPVFRAAPAFYSEAEARHELLKRLHAEEQRIAAKFAELRRAA